MTRGHYVGKYEIIRKLGQGGEGSVFLAKDRDLKRFAAVKRVGGPPQSTDRETDMRIVKEADFLQQLKHPMLPVVYDLLWEDAWYLVMEYVEGVTLREYTDRNGPFPEKTVCLWAGQLLDILAYLHTRKPPVIYRDLKPDNIMVCPDGNLKLVDFGAAYRSCFGDGIERGMAATAGYAAPEQMRRTGACADERSDIYAFGRILYYAVTGSDPAKPPYAARPIYEYQPLLSKRLGKLIQKCTADDPRKRYQTAPKVRRDLAGCGRGRGRFGRRGFVRAAEKKIWLTEKPDNSGSVLLRTKNV